MTVFLAINSHAPSELLRNKIQTIYREIPTGSYPSVMSSLVQNISDRDFSETSTIPAIIEVHQYSQEVYVSGAKKLVNTIFPSNHEPNLNELEKILAEALTLKHVEMLLRFALIPLKRATECNYFSSLTSLKEKLLRLLSKSEFPEDILEKAKALDISHQMTTNEFNVLTTQNYQNGQSGNLFIPEAVHLCIQGTNQCYLNLAKDFQNEILTNAIVLTKNRHDILLLNQTFNDIRIQLEKFIKNANALEVTNLPIMQSEIDKIIKFIEENYELYTKCSKMQKFNKYKDKIEANYRGIFRQVLDAECALLKQTTTTPLRKQVYKSALKIAEIYKKFDIFHETMVFEKMTKIFTFELFLLNSITTELIETKTLPIEDFIQIKEAQLNLTFSHESNSYLLTELCEKLAQASYSDLDLQLDFLDIVKFAFDEHIRMKIQYISQETNQNLEDLQKSIAEYKTNHKVFTDKIHNYLLSIGFSEQEIAENSLNSTIAQMRLEEVEVEIQKKVTISRLIASLKAIDSELDEIRKTEETNEQEARKIIQTKFENNKKVILFQQQVKSLEERSLSQITKVQDLQKQMADWIEQLNELDQQLTAGYITKEQKAELSAKLGEKYEELQAKFREIKN